VIAGTAEVVVGHSTGSEPVEAEASMAVWGSSEGTHSPGSSVVKRCWSEVS